MMLNDKIGRAWELYQLFTQYPEDLLKAVFNQMRTDGIVTKIKVVIITIILSKII